MSLVVVGGNERMKRDYIQLAKNRGYKAKVVLNMSSKVKRSIGSPDAIVIFTSTVSHKLMASVETQAKKQDIPIIRKDFTVDEYMIYEAKVIGADAVLLICAILDDDSLKKYMQTADKLGLSALVETHDEEEVNRAVKAGARLIGVNNRDLRNFTVDINNSLRLRNLVPDNITFVSESGIKGEKEIRELAQGKVDGVLIGETMMRAGESRIETLKSLIKAGQI